MRVISPAEAAANSRRYYFTGKPCKYNHVAKRLLVNGVCVECTNRQRYAAVVEARKKHRTAQLPNDTKVECDLTSDRYE